MKLLKTFVLAAGLLVATAVGAAAQDSTRAVVEVGSVPGNLAMPPSHQAAGERLLRAMNAEKTIERTMELMFESMFAQDPDMAKVQDIMREFAAEVVDWETMGPEMLRAYVEIYSEEELNALAAFYESPVGQRIIEKTPELTARLGLLNQAQMQEKMPELIGRLMERMGEIETKGATKPE